MIEVVSKDKDLREELMKISKRFDGGKLFAGANSGNGFVSFYDTITEDDDIKHIYILKGGPGTGKSSFMRLAGAYAQKKGLAVEKYSCSSDPDSLDAIVMGGKYAILDGTAPHMLDPKCPGAREEIIDLGAFWDSKKLSESYENIKKLSEGKSKSYSMAYRYPFAAKNIRDINCHIVLPFFREEKAVRSVKRLFSDIKCGGGFSIDVGNICSIGMKGKVRYDTYESFADKVYIVEDYFGCGGLFLRLLIKKANESDTPIRVSYDPIDVETPNAVFFANDRKAFVIADDKNEIYADVKINMKRFVDLSGISEIRNEYRFNSRLYEALVDSAIESLENAGKYHFELEKIYESCMDFASKEVFCKNFLEHLF